MWKKTVKLTNSLIWALSLRKTWTFTVWGQCDVVWKLQNIIFFVKYSQASLWPAFVLLLQRLTYFCCWAPSWHLFTELSSSTERLQGCRWDWLMCSTFNPKMSHTSQAAWMWNINTPTENVLHSTQSLTSSIPHTFLVWNIPMTIFPFQNLYEKAKWKALLFQPLF